MRKAILKDNRFGNERCVDDFYAIVRKKTHSLRVRLRRNSNGVLKILSDIPDSMFFCDWTGLIKSVCAYAIY